MKRTIWMLIAASLVMILLVSFAMAESDTLGGVPTSVEGIRYSFDVTMEAVDPSAALPQDAESHWPLYLREKTSFQLFVKTNLEGQTVVLDATPYLMNDNEAENFTIKMYRVDFKEDGTTKLTKLKNTDVTTLVPGQTTTFVLEPVPKALSKPGDYTSMLTLKDADGNLLLEKPMTATIYNFYRNDTPLGGISSYPPKPVAEEKSFFGWTGYSYDYFKLAYEIFGEEWLNANFRNISNDLETVTADIEYLKEARVRLARVLSGDAEGFVGIHVPEKVDGAVLTSDLHFGEDGKFTILTLADIQDDNGFPLADDVKTFIRNAVAAENPDLIVLLGDNICLDYGVFDESKNLIVQADDAIAEYMDVLEECGVPVALVYGNHDSTGTDKGAASKELQMAIYQTYDCFIGAEGPDVTGVGNYNIPIMSSDGSRISFNLWFLDSGLYNNENEPAPYTAVAEDQIAWYVRASNELKELNGGQAVPSFMFQHAPVIEIKDAYVQTETGWTLPEGSVGTLRWLPDTATFTYGQFDAVLQQGDVIAMVTGHDHGNAYVMPYQGTSFVSVPTFSTELYPNGEEFLGTYVLELNESDPTNFEARFINFYEMIAQ